MKIFKRKIPTIFGLLILLLGVGGVVFLTQKDFLKSEKKLSSQNIPEKIIVSNVSEKQFTVSWVTQEATSGFIKYGLEQTMLENVVLDDRDQRSGERGKFKTHFVTLKDLQPEKTYYFKIGSGLEAEENVYDNNGQPYSIIAGPVLTTSQETRILSGRILTEDDKPALETIVYLAAANMAPLSTLTDNSGRWAIFLNKARTKDLTEYTVFDVEASILKIEALNGEKDLEAVILTKNAFPAIPDLVLGHEPYDFRREEMPYQEIQEATESGLITIENPSYSGESLNTLKPEFFGQGPVGAVLEIKLESEPYMTEVEVNDKGSWNFTPPFELEPGTHKVSVTYIDTGGELETISRNFIILAAGESELPAITATPSGDLASPSPLSLPSALPSPSLVAASSPLPSPSSAEPARVTQPTTGGQMPITGTNLPTVLLLLVGIILVLIGFRKVF